MKPDVVYSVSWPEMAPSMNIWMRWHWTKQARERKTFQAVYAAELQAKGNACPKGLERVEVMTKLYYPDRRRRDSDNHGAVLAKWLQDVLVMVGIIPDDTSYRCRFHPPEIVHGGPKRTEVTIHGWWPARGWGNR